MALKRHREKPVPAQRLASACDARADPMSEGRDNARTSQSDAIRGQGGELGDVGMGLKGKQGGLLLLQVHKARNLAGEGGEVRRLPNPVRFHECLDNLTPSELYFGLGRVILERREWIKQMRMTRAASRIRSRPPEGSWSRLTYDARYSKDSADGHRRRAGNND